MDASSQGAEAHANSLKKQKELDESLILAVFSKDVDKAKDLIAEGASVNAADKHGTSALAFAAISGHFPSAKLLLSRGADPDLEDKKNARAAIHYACEGGHSDIVSLLLSRGTVSFDMPDRNQDTPLHLCARLGHVDCLGALLTHLQATTRGGQAPSKILDAVNNRGLSALAEASLFGRSVCVEKLVRAGASVSLRVGPKRITALHLAAGAGHEESVRSLVAAGADLALESEDGLTPVACAESMGKESVVQFLRQAAERQRAQQQTPLTPQVVPGTPADEASLMTATPLVLDSPSEDRRQGAGATSVTPSSKARKSGEEGGAAPMSYVERVLAETPASPVGDGAEEGGDEASAVEQEEDPEEKETDEERREHELRREKYATFLNVFIFVMLSVFALRLFLFFVDSGVETKVAGTLSLLCFAVFQRIVSGFIRTQYGDPVAQLQSPSTVAGAEGPDHAATPPVSSGREVKKNQ